MSGNDALQALESAGIGIQGATESQRQVLESLSAEEVAVLTSVKERLTAASPDVQAHAPEDAEGFVTVGGVVF